MLVGATAVTLATGAVAHAASGSSSSSNFHRHLAGFEPEALDGDTLRLYPGSVSDTDGDVYYSDASIDIDLTTTGAGGLDTGTVSHLTDYFVYLIRDMSSNNLDAVISSSITYTGVALPTGYAHVRKLPFGFVWRTDWTGGAGIPAFHVASWPKPYVRFTTFENGSPWQFLSGGSQLSWTDISLSNYLPDNARLAKVMSVVRSDTTAGSAFVRSTGSQTTGIDLGASNPVDGTTERMTFDIRVTSIRDFQYKVTGGARLDLFCMGYYMTEPS